MHALPRTLIALSIVAAGCGGKSALTVPPPRRDAAPDDGGHDAGRDAGRDGGPDAGPDGGGALVLSCGRADRYSSPGRAITLDAEVVGGTPPALRAEWTVLSRPRGSDAAPAPAASLRTTLVPDLPGDFELRLTATDARGASASCVVTVHSVVGPPVAICPEGELTTAPGAPLLIEGDGYDDEGIASFEWSVLASPPGARVLLDPVDGPVTTFLADVPGRYALQLLVVDLFMERDACMVTVRVTEPPAVECPMEEIRAPTRQPVTLRARASDDTGIASVRWEVVSRPAGSTAMPRPPDAETTRLTPDRQGPYVLRFTATDRDGLVASCEVRVIGLPTAPDATCPATVDTTPLSEVELRGGGVDDGRIVSYRWRLVSAPPGSAATHPMPRDAERTRFRPDVAGEYRIELTVVDDDGQRGTCTFLVRAVATEGLRIEVFWNTGGTDMDTHLLNPRATRYFESDDCYYGNCTGPGLEWGRAGPDDDPSLDIDDTDGFGPENINIDRPETGTFRVGVHAYRGEGLASLVTVRIYCGGSTTSPRETFAASLRGPATGQDPRNDFWRAADVEITSAGGCRITDLRLPDGRPNIFPSDRASSMR